MDTKTGFYFAPGLFMKRNAWMIVPLITVLSAFFLGITTGVIMINEIHGSNKESAKEPVAAEPQYYGFLEINDGQAQTVLHRRAAVLGAEGKFLNLPNGDFLVIGYSVRDGTGYGAIRCPEGIVVFVWRDKPPQSKPHAVRIAKGVNIEAVYR